jgi:phosphoglucosamine mutase
LFSSAGEKLSEQLELAIEARLHAGVEPVTNGAAPVLDPELERAYLTNLIAKAGANLALGGMRIVLDCANGGGSRVAPRVFGRLGAQVTAINAEPDGDNINRDCGSTRPEALQELVRRNGAQLGIALDGDGDRCILVDERGEIVHGDGVLTICARAAAARRAWTDPRIVATVMSNRGLHRALREVGIGVVTVDVGDRHVVEALRREKLQLGGEQSGHIVFGADNHYIGDGTYTALRVLRVLAASGKTLSELAAPYRAFPQVLVNVATLRKPNLAQIPRVVEAVKFAEGELGEDGRVLLRYSGTEPLARVMVEGPDAAVIQRLAQSIAQVLSAEIGGP